MKLNGLDASEDRKIVCWCKTQAFTYGLQGVVDDWANEAV